jgi:hypothetical protein
MTEIKNAVIRKAHISIGDRGFLDVSLDLDYGGTCQSFGGWALYLPKAYKNHNILSVAGHHIFRILEIAGADSWDRLPGKTIRADASLSKVERIGHIVNDDWYNPSKEFEAIAA